ncbi:hypothetical protein FDI69_gp075 [Rhodococcus phage Trina]|uniref:Head-to-tail stopper n=1 Tax=Rhodococcus phage Trina TaxID=2027905 RepID=A0A2D0ZMZ0_9CAUD|nr:hypothetical protein FDI69_gp075 [Rhodococcus phage Trina]ASZ74889.1 hypothetical protein SEA_TRINA_75 [Rhodococcus phage Trina]
MVSCLAAAAYTMKADVWDQVLTYDENTNETVRNWIFVKTIKCLAFPYVDGGIHGAGTKEDFREKYVNSDYARLKSMTNLTKRARITNIRNARTGQLLWSDEDTDNDPATVFNVDGCIPLINPMTGRVNEYLTMLSRAEVSAP